MTELLDRIWHGNTVERWGVALLVALGAYLFLVFLRGTIVRRLDRVARNTPTVWDDLAVELVRRTRGYFIAVLALHAGVSTLAIPGPAGAPLRTLTVLVALMQLARWGNGAISFAVHHHVERRRAVDATGATTIAALGIGARIVFWALLILLALDNLGFDVTTLVAGLGIGGVAIALAVQNILGDLFAALAIVLDKPFVIGDTIAVDAFEGTVEHIGLKTTRIRSVNGEQIVISNAELLKGRIRNFKGMTGRRVVFHTDIDYGMPAERVEALPAEIRAIVASQPGVRFERSHFKRFGESGLQLETVYHLTDTDYLRFMDTQQAINLAILRAHGAEEMRLAHAPGAAARTRPEAKER